MTPSKDSLSVLTAPLGIPQNAQTKWPKCREPGCHRDAQCLPKLWVPSHPLSPKRFDGVASTMGLPYCFAHFHRLKVRDFLRSEEVRKSIEEDFRKHGAIAWWDQAKLFQIRRKQAEFRNWMILQARHHESRPV